MKIFGFALASLASADTFAPTSASTSPSTSASTSAHTTVSTSAETGNAFIEITLANVENAGFKERLRKNILIIYIIMYIFILTHRLSDSGIPYSSSKFYRTFHSQKVLQ